MVKVSYTVTFEFDRRPPLTHRGVVDGSSPSAIAGKAVRAAKKALRPINWSSFVFVAVDRGESAAGEDARAIVGETRDGPSRPVPVGVD